jgi:sterol 3beta-glucosyltransferase
MKVAIPTIGSRGDVQPFIALAQGLTRAGHEVTLATHPPMRSLVESYGTSFRPIGPNIDFAHEAALIRENSRNHITALIRTMRLSFDILKRSHHDILNLCREADLVVVSAQSAAGKNEADLLNLPYLSVTLMPWAIPWNDPERPLLKRVAYHLIDEFVQLATTRPLNQIRKEQGLSPIGREGFTSLRMNLIPVSPAVYAPNPNWDSRHHVTGYWFIEEVSGWQPSSDLLSFLDAGEPPVAIRLGSMGYGESNKKEILHLVVDAIQQSGQRGILQGWGTWNDQMSLPSTILTTGTLPHNWLFPRCAAVVHHGGYGTTAACLRAGRPALVIPHIADQFYWAKIVHDLGVGPKPVPQSKLTRADLVGSIDELINSDTMLQTATSLGNQIRSETGVQDAVNYIQAEFS